MPLDFSAYMAPVTYDRAKATVVAILIAQGMPVDDWIAGSEEHQWLEAMTWCLVASSDANALAAQSNFLATATDPGDVTPEGVTRDPSFGPPWLSSKGSNDYGTDRDGETFGTGTVTLENTGSTPYVLSPGSASFQDASTGATFTLDVDPTIYVESGGTYTLAAGASGVVLPAIADESGSASSAVANALAMTTVLPGVSATASSSIAALDLETADVYRARCLLAPAITSPGGPADTYRYLASTQIGGAPLLRTDRIAPVAISRVQVSPPSTTGGVNVYFADPDGAPSTEDFDAADANITANGVPIGITYTGHKATENTVAVTYTARAAPGSGVTVASVKASVLAGLTSFFQTIPVGGYDQDAGGAGSLSVSLLEMVIGRSHPAIYKVTVTLPGGDVSMALGDVAKRGTLIDAVVVA